MLSHNQRISVLMVLSIGVALLAASCAEQDLYEVPGSPFSVVGRLALPSQNEDVAILERTAFIAGGQAGLHSVDFTDPGHPVLLQTINTLKYSESVNTVRTFEDHVLQDIALVVEGTEGITSYDITAPGEMESFNTNTTGVFGNRAFVQQPEDPDAPFIVYLAESWKGVRVFQSLENEPGILTYNGVFAGTNGYAESIAVKDGYGYVADDEMGLGVLDVRILDLGTVQLVSWCDSPGEALDVAIDGDYAFVADGDEGLAVYSIDGGEAPVRIAQLGLEGKCRAIEVKDGLAVLAAQGSGTHFVDVSDPKNPKFLGRVLSSYAMDLAFSYEGILLVVDRDDGLLVLMSNQRFADEIAPARINNLAVEPYGVGSVLLSWHCSGDDRYEGLADDLEIRHATSTIVDEATWDAAEVLETPTPGAPGERQELIVEDLELEVERHFAVRLRDEAGNLSDLSNPASSLPGTGILLLDPAVDVQAGTDQQTYIYEASFIFPATPTVHQVVIDGTPHDMDLVEAKVDVSLYRYTTQLDKGEHDYYFRFEVADVTIDPVQTELSHGPTVGKIVYQAGSPDNELGRLDDEWSHTVVLSDSLVASATEISQAEWVDLGLDNPSDFVGDDLPVETITWDQAIAYCNARSSDDGLTAAYTISGTSVTWNHEADGWRLPTEAEWEWLARAGSTTALPGGDLTVRICNVDPVLEPMAWYCGSFAESTPGTRNVGTKNAGPTGLYDMPGNVAEWCWDWYGDVEALDTDGDGVLLDPMGAEVGSDRVVRGGSWDGASDDCRSAARNRRFPDSADNRIGLRVVRTIFTN